MVSFQLMTMKTTNMKNGLDTDHNSIIESWIIHTHIYIYIYRFLSKLLLQIEKHKPMIINHQLWFQYIGFRNHTGDLILFCCILHIFHNLCVEPALFVQKMSHLHLTCFLKSSEKIFFFNAVFLFRQVYDAVLPMYIINN